MSKKPTQLDCHYRVSAKALVYEDESKQKFLICQEDNGKWEFPGGGLDHGETPQADIPREIDEEMGLEVLSVAPWPTAFLTFDSQHGWMANVLYETRLNDLKFTPSSECMAIKFVNAEEALAMDCFPNVKKYAKQLLSERTN